MKNIILVSYSFIAALIGAGFASGQEILCYFSVFGKSGAFGIILVSVFCAVFIYAVLNACIRLRPSGFGTFLSGIGSRRAKALIHFTTIVFSFAVFSAMLSAFGELFKIFDISARTGALITSIACVVILSFNTGRIFDINGTLGLLLTAAITTCCIYILRYREYHAFSQLTPVIENAGIYSGYNLMTSLPVLILMSRRIKNRREAAGAAFLSATASGLLMFMIFYLTAMYYGKIPLGELPMLTLAQRQGPFFAFIYHIILITASATTLLSAGGSIIESLPFKKSPLSAAAISACGFCLSGMGFSGIINTVYRICGAAGIIICIYISAACFSPKLKN